MMDDWSFDLSELGPEVEALNYNYDMPALDMDMLSTLTSGMEGLDLSAFDAGNYDFGTGALDMGTLLDLSNAGLDLGGLDLSAFDAGNYDFGTGALDASMLEALQNAGLDLGGDGYGFAGYDLGGTEDLDEAARQARLAEYGVQNLGPTSSPTDAEGYLKLSGYDEGRLPSQWQTVGDSDLKVMVQDDGSAIGMNTATGTSFGLEQEQVQNLVKQGLINTYKSGYFTATGGSKVAPGGGITTTKDGKTYTLKPDGKLYDTDTGKVITNTNTIKEVINQIRTTGGAGGVST